MANKAKGPKLYFSQFGGEQPIPPEFVAAMERTETVQAVPNDVTPEALGDLIVESKVETNRTDERVRKTVGKKAGNITLNAVNTNDQGQPVQITKTLFPTGTTPTEPSATATVAVHDLGNGWSIQEVGIEGTYVGGVFTPGVFSGNLYSKERPNLVPQEFRPTVPTITTRVDSAGTAVAPTLSGDELRETQEQLTAFKKRITIETQASPSLPVTLDKGRDTNNEKQDVVVTRILNTDVTTAPTATALKDVRVQQLGDGNKVIETREISAVFGSEVFRKDRPNLIPEEFRPAIPTVTTRVDSSGTAVAPTLSGTELSETQQQVNALVKRIEITTQAAPSLPVTLDQNRATNQNKQDVVVTRVLNVDATTAPTATALKDVEVRQLGDGNKVIETKEIAAIFTSESFQRERPNLIPQEFRPAIPTVTTRVNSVGTATDPTLSGTELAQSEEQLDAFIKRTTTSTQAAPSLPVTLDKGRDTNQAKQDVTVTKTLIADATVVATATALKDVEVQQLGDGNKVQITKEVVAVFGANVFSKEVPNLVPAKFKPSIPTVVTRIDESGTAATPTISGDEFEETQEQVNTFVKRTTVKSEAAPSAPIMLTEYETNQAKQLATVQEVYEAVGSAPSDPTALTQVQTNNLGNGFQVRRLSTVDSVFPETTNRSVQVFQLPEKFRNASATLVTTSTVSAGTVATPATLGTGGTGVLQSTARRKDITVVQVDTETLTATPSTNTLYAIRDGQLVTITETLVADNATAPSVSATTEVVERNVLGGGKAEQRVGTVATVFDRANVTDEQAFKVPEKFYSAITIPAVTSSVSAGTTATPTSLGSDGMGVIKSRAQRIDATKVQVEDVTIANTVTSVTEYNNTKGQLVTVTDSIVADSSAPSAPSATTEVLEQRVLGGGKAERRVGTVGSLFPETRVSDIGEAAGLDREIQHFFVAYKQERTSSVSAGTTATPTALAAPTTTAALATGIGVIESVAERIDATKVRVTDTTVTASSLGSLGGFELDKETGAMNAVTRAVVAAGTAGVALASDGTYSEVTPFNTRFSIKTTRKATAAFSRSYTIYEHVSSLPRVLTVFSAVVFTDKPHREPYGNDTSEASGATTAHPDITYAEYENPWHVNPGGNILHAGFDIQLKDFNGIYAVAVEEEWSNTAFSLAAATAFRPEGFSWTTPFGSGSVPECLHAEVEIDYTTGTTHPTYDYIAGSYVFAATSPATLTGTIVLEHTQHPYLGGYRRLKKSITI